MKFLPLIALLLLALWIVAKLFFAVTGMLLHLLWIIAVLVFLLWLAFFFLGKKSR